MTAKILVLPGDGIGPEITAQAEKVLDVLRAKYKFDVEWSHGLLGGIAPLCVATVRRWPGRAIAALALAGVAAIAAAVGGFGPETTYPSYLATLPALGAMLIIVSGLADPRNLVEFAGEAPQIGIVDNPAQITFEVAVID